MTLLTKQDLVWRTTFPQLVSPLPNEWLPGVLLRCDEVNGWESGTTLAEVFLRQGRRGGVPFFNAIAPNSFPYRIFADLLAAPVATIFATTYWDALSRLFETPRPHPSQLGPFQRLNNPICPRCAEDELLPKYLAFSFLTMCPYHALYLQRQCLCGVSIRYCSRGKNPFSCSRCSTRWASLPHIQGSEGVHAYEGHFLALACYLLKHGNKSCWFFWGITFVSGSQITM